MSDRPYFLWSEGERLSEEALRAKLCSDDPRERALWMGRVLREARFNDVWRYVSLQQVLADWPLVERHLGRRRAFWQFTLGEWRRLGLISDFENQSPAL
jgi:hypothetical protein